MQCLVLRFFLLKRGYIYKKLQWDPENSGIGRRLLESSYDFK